jgi:hypothetical protein
MEDTKPNVGGATEAKPDVDSSQQINLNTYSPRLPVAFRTFVEELSWPSKVADVRPCSRFAFGPLVSCRRRLLPPLQVRDQEGNSVQVRLKGSCSTPGEVSPAAVCVDVSFFSLVAARSSRSSGAPR